MSATGQGGVSLITGSNHATFAPVTLPLNQQLVFTHNVGRRAFSVIVTSGDPAGNYGQVLNSTNSVLVTQPDENTIIVRYSGLLAPEPIVFISCRWEEPTPELDLVPVGDSRVEIVPVPITPPL